MILSQCLFLACVDKGQILSLVMLPNTQHIGEDQKLNTKNRLNDVLAFHSTRKVASGRLCLLEDDVEGWKVQLYANSPFKSEEIKSHFFAFQKSKKRYLAHDLIDENGELKIAHPRQQDYLNSKLISHCWAAVHKGHVVGLIAYPLIRSKKLHDKNFEKYKDLSRVALQCFGYVVACDLVLNDQNQLELYNIHQLYEKKGKAIPYFTRLLPVTKHLRFIPFDKKAT